MLVIPGAHVGQAATCPLLIIGGVSKHVPTRRDDFAPFIRTLTGVRPASFDDTALAPMEVPT